MERSDRRGLRAGVTGAFVGVALALGCGGAPGILVDAGSDVAFVREPGAVVIDDGHGIVAVALDGTRTRTLFSERRRLEAVSSDYRVWVGSDSDTNLFIGDLEAGVWQRVPELDGIASDAAISPDGSRVIASRHADYGLQRGEDDDTLYLIDVASLAVEVLPKTQPHWPTELAWAADGKGVRASMAFEAPAQWINLTTKTRRAATPADPPTWVDDTHKRAPCDRTIEFRDFDTEIRVESPSGTVVVAREEGRKRGFHDYGSDFGTPQLTPGCGYVLFAWDARVWLADATGSGANGPLASGAFLFFAGTEVLGPT
jgi:dipeptidyl aminopeptidase/acylaminoacyl peptidase